MVKSLGVYLGLEAWGSSAASSALFCMDWNQNLDHEQVDRKENFYANDGFMLAVYALIAMSIRLGVQTSGANRKCSLHPR